MSLPAQSQIAAGLRYAGTIAGSVGSMAVVIGLLPPDSAQNIVNAFQKLMGDLQPVFGDVYVLVVLVGPIIVSLLTRMGVKAASPKSQATDVQSRNDMQVLTSNPEVAKEIPGVRLVPSEQITLTPASESLNK